MRVALRGPIPVTAQKMKFFIKDFFRRCEQIRRKLRIWSHLLKKFLTENFIFSALCEPINPFQSSVTFHIKTRHLKWEAQSMVQKE